MQAEIESIPFEPDDLDSLHALPLAIMPLETKGLRRALMMKNARLDGVVELFRDARAGSGQVEPNQLSSFFGDDDGALQRDISVITSLARLSSYDVYTLRAELRRLDIGFSDYKALSLSDKKRAELTEYMTAFTRPLIVRIFGSEQQIDDVSQIISMLVSPNREESLKRLQSLANELDIEISEVPAFLENYGDIFLSLAYFRQCLDHIMSLVPEFLEWLEEARTFYQVKSDANQDKLIVGLSAAMNEISTSVVGRFEVFDQRSQDFWDNINAASFQEFRRLVTAHHVSIGAVLCGLAVKMDLWQTRFPNRGGGPEKRLDFIGSEIRPGLARIRDIEKDANTGL